MLNLAMGEAAKGSYVLIFIALVAAAAAIFFGYVGAKLIFLAATFGNDVPLEQGATMVFGLLSYLSVVTAAVLFPFVSLAAAAIAWLCWKTGTARTAA
ncbi:MAG TPA: hypothetical protein VL754_03860 [Verrucomicrobiae bacterium]|jgi:hypothetical protein|nr:hypothetical protein [Verrucomicrobiae bacterium]